MLTPLLGTPVPSYSVTSSTLSVSIHKAFLLEATVPGTPVPSYSVTSSTLSVSIHKAFLLEATAITFISYPQHPAQCLAGIKCQRKLLSKGHLMHTYGFLCCILGTLLISV